MGKCELCSRESEYKDPFSVRKKGTEYFLKYCRAHKNIGLRFGWIEEAQRIAG